MRRRRSPLVPGAAEGFTSSGTSCLQSRLRARSGRRARRTCRRARRLAATADAAAHGQAVAARLKPRRCARGLRGGAGRTQDAATTNAKQVVDADAALAATAATRTLSQAPQDADAQHAAAKRSAIEEQVKRLGERHGHAIRALQEHAEAAIGRLAAAKPKRSSRRRSPTSTHHSTRRRLPHPRRRSAPGRPRRVGHIDGTPANLLERPTRPTTATRTSARQGASQSRRSWSADATVSERGRWTPCRPTMSLRV